VDKEDRIDDRDTFVVVSASLDVLMLEIENDDYNRFIFANFV